jgi:hypothetical protein
MNPLPPLTVPAWLTTLSFCRVRIVLKAWQEGTLRGFYTSVLRGWFHHRLQRLCPCRFLGPTGFAQCTLKQRCTWGLFFGELPTPTTPRPYLIELDQLTSDRHRRFTSGESLPVTLVLIGQGVAHLDSVVGAFLIDGGRLTLGRNTLSFEVTHIETLQADGRPLPYFQDNRRIGAPCLLTLAEVMQHATQGITDELDVELLTPLATKHGNVLVGKTREFSFVLLLRAILRRLYDLATAVCGYSGAKPDFDILLRQAATIERTRGDLRWVDFPRFSSRQQSLMDFGGWVGRIGFRGDFAPFLPYLLLGANLHIGRHTSFGFGRFRCSFAST